LEGIGKRSGVRYGRRRLLRLRVETKTYNLNAVEIPAFCEFHANISPVLGRLSSFPAAEFALLLYSANDGERLDFSAAVTALEALLTKDGETEGLTYRLSMRIANLLGPDATARKAKFNEMKKFYNLRSKIVHGSPIAKTSLDRPLDGLAQLRETVRRVLLSALALFADGSNLINCQI
jgi:hypothetical protein